MRTLTITVPDELGKELEPYEGDLGELLSMAVRTLRMQRGLALYQEGACSLWKAAREAGVSLREMAQFAVAHGVRATVDDETFQEELA